MVFGLPEHKKYRRVRNFINLVINYSPILDLKLCFQLRKIITFFIILVNRRVKSLTRIVKADNFCEKRKMFDISLSLLQILKVFLTLSLHPRHSRDVFYFIIFYLFFKFIYSSRLAPFSPRELQQLGDT